MPETESKNAQTSEEGLKDGQNWTGLVLNWSKTV